MYTNLPDVPVAVATTDVVAVFNVANSRLLGVQLTNNGTTALDAFEVWGKTSPKAVPVKLADAAANYTTPVYPVIRATSSPVTLAKDASAMLFLNVEGLAEVQLKASSATSAGKLSINAVHKFSV